MVLATIGGGSPISKELVIGSETVGTVTEYRPSIDGSKSFKDSLKSSTTVKEYVDTFEKMGANNLPVTSLVLEFNSNFSKYNVNRLVEFEINSNTTNLVDYSLVRKRGLSGSSNAVVDSSGTSHTLEKRFTSYLLNPYDSKGIALDTTKSYISVNDAPKGTPVSNELTIGMDWGYATKPNYLDTVYTPATGSFKVSNRESSADSIIARKGSLLTYRLPDDSLFATSKYSVGDIVSVTYLDNVLNEERVSSNRFTDTDNYVNVEKPAADSSQNRKGFAKFKLVERTDKGYKWELLEDISMKNSTFYMNTESLTPVEFRSDWVSKFGETNLKRFLEGTTRSASSYLGKEQLKAYVTWTSNGVTKDVSTDGLINKNTNLILGENTTGTLKVVHKSDTGEILKAESVVADNKPWYTPVTIDPQNFDGYQFKRSSEVLSTTVGSGTRTIELIYAKPSERVSKEPIPVTYVVDNTKDGNYRNEVVGTPKITTTRTEYIYSADTRTSTSKETVTVQEGTPTVVTLGTKPTTEVTYQDFTTRYVADPTRTAGEKFTETAGVRGTTTTETTYSVNKETGVVTPTKGQPVVVAPKEAVVKVGTKPTVTETSIPVTTKYKADNSIDFGKEEVESQGQAGTRTTTAPKVLNTTNGMVSDGQPTTKETPMTPKVVKKGTKPKVVETPVNFDTVYEADETKGKGVRTDKVVGVQGKVITTTTYTLNETTGVVTTTTYTMNPTDGTTTANKPTVDTTPMVQRVVKVGVKKKVVETPIEFTTRYERDETADAGKKTPSVSGVAGKTITTTTYTMNPTTGVVTENPSTTVREEPTTAVIKVGAKSKVVVTPIPVEVEEVADPELFEGDEKVTSNGKAGSTTTTTEYVVNPKTGEITEKDPVVSIIPMEKKIVHKGTKKRKATVTISYVLKDNGSSLGSPTVLENQQVGSPYNTSVKVFEPKVEVSELPDRTITKTTTYVLEKEPENKSGIVTEKGVSVVYTYRAMVREEVVMKESKLTVNFVLEGSGEKLHESLVKEGVRVGDPYVTEPLALKDKVEKRVERNKEVITTTRYELVETPSNAKGAISVGGTAVDYFYRAVVKVDEYPTIPNNAPKTDLPEYTNPIGTPGIPEVHDKPTYLGHVGTPGDSEVHELPEFNGGVVPNDAPKVEIPAYDNGVVPNYAPIHEVPEYTEPLGFVPSDAPQFELPEFKGGVVPNDAPILEKPEYKIPTVSEEPKQPAVPVVEIPQSQPQRQAPQQQFVAKELPNTGTSDSDKLVALSGVGLLGLLGFSFKKRKED